MVLSDQVTGRILAIDATGDGDFRGVGDVLFHDIDGDGFPDLWIDSETGVAAVELMVFPLNRIGEENEIAVELQLLNAEGVWESQQKSILIPSPQCCGSSRSPLLRKVKSHDLTSFAPG